jgi:hypothetical protein
MPSAPSSHRLNILIFEQNAVVDDLRYLLGQRFPGQTSESIKAPSGPTTGAIQQAVHAASELALQTDKEVVLATSVLDALRHRHIILPTLDVIERRAKSTLTAP